MNKKMSVLNKLITFLNDVTDEAEAIIDVAEIDKTDSGNVTLSYTLDSGDVVTVDAEKYVRDANMELLEEGSYLLEDGNFLVVDADGKMVETAEEVADEAAGEEAPIAENKQTKVKQSKIKKAVKVKQEDEVADAEVPSTATVTIDGVDYEVPQEVADYIKKLESEAGVSEAEIEQFKTKVNKFKTELSQLKSKLPSGKFVSEVKSVNQSKEMSVEASIANALARTRK